MKIKEKRSKLFIITFVIAFVSVLLFVLIFFIVKNENVTLESLYKGKGATIYDKDANKYLQISISKTGEWISYNDLPKEITNKLIKSEIYNDIPKLIIEQFKGKGINKILYTQSLKMNSSEKKRIEFFLNTVYLGDGVFGISSGAKHFYGCEINCMAPYMMKNFGELIVNYITKGDYFDTTILFKDSILYEEDGYVDSVIHQTANILMSQGMSEYEAYKEIYLGNLSINTYLDTTIQNKVNEKYGNRETFTIDKSKNEYVQSGIVIMDDKGNIVALSTGNQEDKVFNRATERNNQVGSTIKPVSTYALAIDEKLINFSSLVENIQQSIMNEQGEYIQWPTNSDGQYGGFETVTQALQESKNTIAILVAMKIGKEKIYNFLNNKLDFNLTAYDNNNTDCQLSALTLGYFYKGIPLNKLGSAYEMFINNGKYYDTSLISEISNRREKKYVDSRREKQVISESSAYIMNRLLFNNVNGKYGIGNKAAIKGREVLGKTGTVAKDSDTISKLFVGIDSKYIATIWVGCEDGKSLALKSYKDPAEIFNEIFCELTIPNINYLVPKSIIKREFCEKSGDLATGKCEKKSIGYYTDDNMPKECTSCK